MQWKIANGLNFEGEADREEHRRCGENSTRQRLHHAFQRSQLAKDRQGGGVQVYNDQE
jgi:hypothetical protein